MSGRASRPLKCRRIDDGAGGIGRAVDAICADTRRRDVQRRALGHRLRHRECKLLIATALPVPLTVTVVSPEAITHTGRGIDAIAGALRANVPPRRIARLTCHRLGTICT